jgi:neutral amino acid transport system substrate-binding protein
MLQGKGSFAILAGILLVTAGFAGCLQQQEIERVGCMDGNETGTAGLSYDPSSADGAEADPPAASEEDDELTVAQQDPNVPQLKLGTILPLTGGLSPYGPASENAVKMAVQQVNDAGGVNGQQVELVTADSESSEDAASQAVNNLINVEEVHGLVGAMGSGVSLSFIDQVVDAEIPMISPANTGTDFTEMSANGETEGWYFRTVPSDALQGAVMAQLAHDEGHETASVLAIDNAYGNGFGDVFQESFEEQGGEVLNFVNYNPEGSDFSSDVEAATEDDPDVIVAVGYPDTGRIFMQNAYDRGHAGGNPTADWLFSEGFKNETGFVDQLPNVTFEGEEHSIVEGCKGTTPMETTRDAFVEDYQSEYEGEPALFADRSFDAAMLMMLASEHCDCVEGQQFQDAIVEVQNPPGQEVEYDAQQALTLLRAGQDIQWTGAAGPMEFDENHDVTAPYAIWEVNEGEIEVVEEDIVP